MSESAAHRVLLVFLDGVGLGPAEPSVNAFVDHAPFLSRLLGAPPIAASVPRSTQAATLGGLDATLGSPGLPQSGTGQATLLTGENAVRLHGRHFGPWVPTRLRPIVRERSILATTKQAGLAVAFANAYPEEIVVAARTGVPARNLPRFLRAGPPLAALAAGVLDRHTGALQRGDAIASEILNEGWRDRLGRTDLPRIGPADAGRNLARIAASHRFTLFAHYGTDTAGHVRDIDAARAAVQLVDAFFAGLVPALSADTLLVVASDHGNLEDSREGHTRNPALLVTCGPGHATFAAGLHDLTHPAPAIGALLGALP